MDENAPATMCRKVMEADMRLVHNNNNNIDAEPTAENETKDHGTSCQKTEEANIVNKQIPAILDPRNRYALVKIVNQLDPCSFINLAKTSRAMHDFCFTSKDIKITYNVDRILCERDPFYDLYTLEFYSHPMYRNEVLESVKARRRIQDWYPFVFSIRLLYDDDEWHFTEGGIAILRRLLDNLPIQKISKVSAYWEHVVSWDSFFRFLQDFHVESVSFSNEFYFLEFPEEIMRRLVTSELKMFSCSSNLDMLNQAAILKATVPILDLRGLKLSVETFDALVLKCIDSIDNIDWSFGIHDWNSPFELHDRGLYKTFPFNYDGPIPEERPIVFVKEDDPLYFYMLRKNDTVFCSSPAYDVYYRFSVSNNPNDWPPCIRSIGIPIDVLKTLSITY